MSLTVKEACGIECTNGLILLLRRHFSPADDNVIY
jgi:hypothetical protein